MQTKEQTKLLHSVIKVFHKYENCARLLICLYVLYAEVL